MDSAGTLAQVASAVFSLGLLVATVAYTYFNYLSIKRETNPIIKPSIEYTDPETIEFVIRNTGNGPAHDVDASWRPIEPAGIGNSCHIDTILPGEMHRFAIPLPGPQHGYTEIQKITEQIGSREGTIYFEVTCTDILNRSHDDDDTVSIREALSRTSDASEIIAPDDLADVRNALVELAHVVNSTADSVDRVDERDSREK